LAITAVGTDGYRYARETASPFVRAVTGCWLYCAGEFAEALLAMLFKYLIIAVLVAILISLASGLMFLFRDDGNSTRTVKALTVRITLSVALFALLVIGYFAGYIKPHGNYPQMPVEHRSQQ